MASGSMSSGLAKAMTALLRGTEIDQREIERVIAAAAAWDANKISLRDFAKVGSMVNPHTGRPSPDFTRFCVTTFLMRERGPVPGREAFTAAMTSLWAERNSRESDPTARREGLL